MRHHVLLRLVHLSICLAVILEDRIPACTSQSKPVRNRFESTSVDIPKLVGPRAGTIFPFARVSGDSSERQVAAAAL